MTDLIGYIKGFDDCKSELMEVIESLAYQVALYKYPSQDAYSDEQLNSIMLEAGLDEDYLEDL